MSNKSLSCLDTLYTQGKKLKFPICPDGHEMTFHWLYSTNPVKDRAKCHTHPTFGCPQQDWWKTANEMSNFMSTGQMGISFVFALLEAAY